ncbi:MAG: hypothetical protein AB1640_00680 [bacterium]
MPADTAARAWSLVRDPSHFQWYVIPLLFMVVYVYANEIERRNWSAVLAGLTFWGLDWFNEIWNGLLFHFTNYAPAWGTPGQSAYVILIGLNIEITFMFAVFGIVWVKQLPRDRTTKIMGIPNRLFVAVAAALFCVFVEYILNSIGALTWEWPWWNRGAPWLIFLFGYFYWFVIGFWVYDAPKLRTKLVTAGSILAADALCLAVFIPLGWI